MPNISLPTGKVIYVSIYDYYFQLKDEDLDEFFQNCVADDLGMEINNPFSNAKIKGSFEIEDIPEEEFPEDYE